jgi:peptidoglycan L-alanyl-D-glutamate endopeptidase CwlK
MNKHLERLEKVHPDLAKLIKAAAEDKTCPPFFVLQGQRTREEQVGNVAKGVSQTMHSRHVCANNRCGECCAVDLGCYDAHGKLTWDYPHYQDLAKAVKRIAKKLGVPIEWGGDWKSLKDGTHFQLPWGKYP